MFFSRTTPAPRNARLAGRAAIIVGLMVAACLVLPWLAAWEQQRFAEQLARRAIQSIDGASVATVRKLSHLGPPAIEPLAALAASQRAEVAKAAQGALADKLAGWELAFAERGDARELSEQLQALSGALELHAAHFGGAGQRWAQRLTRQIVANCAHLPAGEAWTVLARCEVVLAVPPSSITPREATAAIVESPAIEADATTNASAGEAAPEVSSPLANERPQLAEISVVDPPPSPPAGVAPPPKGANSSVTPLNPLRYPDDAARRTDPSIEPGFAAPVAEAPLPVGTVIDVPSPQDMRHLTRKLREMGERELLARVAAAPKFEAMAARRILRERGYTDAIVEMTRQLEQLSAAERREALDRAASLPAAEARRLLRWFVADEDAEVRLLALTMLATTGDPQLQEIARRRAVEDADPRVAELATELMKRK